MQNIVRAALLSSCVLATVGCAVSQPKPLAQVSEPVATAQSLAGLTVVTWNMEHLALPAEGGCRPRQAADFDTLRAYAAGLRADIVALQEVASADAVKAVFPESDWQVIMSARADSPAYECRGSGNLSTPQKVAYAVKKSVPVVQVEQFDALALNNPGLRFGLGLTVSTALGQVELLNVHMKSGCFVDDFSQADSPACQTYAQQAPVLDSWVEQREKAGKPYLVLGDFNHRLSASYNRMTRTLTQNSDGSASSLQITTRDLIGCDARYPAPIDHILAGGWAGDVQVPAAEIHVYENMQRKAMLSDHCPVSLTLKAAPKPLSNAVKWQTTSKEYRVITSAIYQSAAESVRARSLPQTPWVVVMDIDETVLDNSAYQAMRERMGKGYSRESWKDWVISEKASLVPGVAGFIDAVLAGGGKLMLITNRDKSLDGHTWANLLALGLPLSADNTCLVGRRAQDKQAIDHKTIINDKDLRRQQIRQGNPDCLVVDKQMPASWKQPHQILMQVGDNIEDVEFITQEDADVDALLKRWGGDVIVLPNPMYGSW